MNKKVVTSLLFTAALLVGCSAEKEVVHKPINPVPKPTTAQKEPLYVSSFTGSPLHEEETNQYFSVMIENSPDARPQSGLSQADLVYEIQTEGAITRYLAFFHDEIPKEIGPVRSARHYFIPLAEERNVPYIHFGASKYAYTYLQKGLNIPSIDGIVSESKYFKRDKNRRAPHNAYLLTDKLPSFTVSLTGNPYTFSNEPNTIGEKGEKISISFNSFTDVSYAYDAKKEVYLRSQEGKPHVDALNGKPIETDNILLRFAEHTSMKDGSGRINVALSGENKAILLRNGLKIEGVWKTKDEKTVFYDNQGNLLQLKPGKTWIEVVHNNLSITFN